MVAKSKNSSKKRLKDRRIVVPKELIEAVAEAAISARSAPTFTKTASWGTDTKTSSD